MSSRSIVICGLPGSGKTTFLAALWHLVFQREEHDTKLKIRILRNGDYTHLNEITARWQEAREQVHTHANSRKLVSMNLKDCSENTLELTFPDLSGESYQQMWETRECDPDIAAILRSADGVLLFAHADKINRPLGVAEAAGQARRLGTHRPRRQTRRLASQVCAHPSATRRTAPASPFACARCAGSAARHHAFCLGQGRGGAPRAGSLPRRKPSASRSVSEARCRRLGLQDLRRKRAGRRVRAGNSTGRERFRGTRAKIDAIRALPTASSRIKLYSPGLSRDLTEPLAWLME